MRRFALGIVLGALLVHTIAAAAPKILGGSFIGGTILSQLNFSPDNTIDVGGSHTTLRPRNIFAGTLIDSPKFTTSGTGSFSGVTINAGESVGAVNAGRMNLTTTFLNGAVGLGIDNGNAITATSGGNGVVFIGGAGFTNGAKFSPGSGSGSFAALQVNPEISGTSSGTAYALGVASKTNTLTGGTIKLASFGTTTTDLFTGYTALADIDTTGLTRSTLYGSITRCANTAAPAVCAAAPAGSVVIAAAAASVVVNTTAVTANSQIFVQIDRSLGSLLSVTCDTTSDLTTGSPAVTARTAATSFTIAVPVAPAANPMCLSYFIVN